MSDVLSRPVVKLSSNLNDSFTYAYSEKQALKSNLALPSE
jgi:hypothetical protein